MGKHPDRQQAQKSGEASLEDIATAVLEEGYHNFRVIGLKGVPIPRLIGAVVLSLTEVE